MSVIEDEVHSDLKKVYTCPCYFNRIVLVKKKSYLFSWSPKFYQKKDYFDFLFKIHWLKDFIYMHLQCALKISCLETEIICGHEQ